MNRPHLFREILPVVFLFILLLIAAILADAFLHWIGWVWVGRYFGIIGTVLIIASFVYSLRKYGAIHKGQPKTLLAWHEYLAWSGSVMILIHGGIHFNALLPWYALATMVIVVASGLTGKFLLQRSRSIMEVQRTKMSGADEKDSFWDATTYELMKRWRHIHLPLTLIFGLLAFFHILTVLIFWRWR